MNLYMNQMCNYCRDPNREPRLIRKRTKEQFRFELKNELQNYEPGDIVEINEENQNEKEYDKDKNIYR